MTLQEEIRYRNNIINRLGYFAVNGWLDITSENENTFQIVMTAMLEINERAKRTIK